MANIKPTKDNVLIELILRSQVFADAVHKRSGLYVPPPENKMHSFEGIPNEGIVFALFDGYAGPLKVGDRVVFNESNPKGFKFEGHKLLPVKVDQIMGVIDEQSI